MYLLLCIYWLLKLGCLVSTKHRENFHSKNNLLKFATSTFVIAPLNRLRQVSNFHLLHFIITKDFPTSPCKMKIQPVQYDLPEHGEVP